MVTAKEIFLKKFTNAQWYIAVSKVQIGIMKNFKIVLHFYYRKINERTPFEKWSLQNLTVLFIQTDNTIVMTTYLSNNYYLMVKVNTTSDIIICIILWHSSFWQNPAEIIVATKFESNKLLLDLLRQPKEMLKDFQKLAKSLVL